MQFIYGLGALLFTVLGFLNCYQYAIAEYGTAGLLLGWLPALFLAPLIGVAWPLVLIARLLGWL
jgi:hypothetical protein